MLTIDRCKELMKSAHRNLLSPPVHVEVAEQRPVENYELPDIEKPDVYRSLSKDGMPTASWLEKKRMSGMDLSILRKLGL